MRLRDSSKLSALLLPYLKDNGFDLYMWLKDRRNIALVDDHDNVALFEPFKPNVYLGHYYFLQRGKDAVKAATRFLQEVFSRPGVEALVGLTPENERGARWLSRHIGFKSSGIVQTAVGPCELFVLTRQEYRKNYLDG